MTDVEGQHFVYQGELFPGRQVLSKQGIDPVNVYGASLAHRASLRDKAGNLAWVARVAHPLARLLATYVRKSMLTIESALGIQIEMEDLMREREYDTSSLEVLSLIGLCNCSAYDCEFIALAQSLESRLVTADVRLHHAFPDDSVLLTDLVA